MRKHALDLPDHCVLEDGLEIVTSCVNAVLNDGSPFAPERQGTIAYSDRQQLDAVYIPTTGRHRTLGTPLDLLLGHAREVVLLCSHGAPSWAIDDPRVRVLTGLVEDPAFARFLDKPSSRNPSRLVTRRYDLPFKRNLALDDARSRGLGVISLLDDDISLSSEQIAQAARAAGAGQISGFYVLDYPDVSVVDHLWRLTRTTPARVSLGGNCIFLPPATATGFFPYVYNEDWFFLHMNHLAGVPVRGLGCAGQFAHEPWRDAVRTRFEQFGDVMAHGLKVNVEAGRPAFAGGSHFWSEVLEDFRTRLAHLVGGPGLSGHMLTAAREAMLEAAPYGAQDLVDFRDAMILEWEN